MSKKIIALFAIIAIVIITLEQYEPSGINSSVFGYSTYTIEDKKTKEYISELYHTGIITRFSLEIDVPGSEDRCIIDVGRNGKAFLSETDSCIGIEYRIAKILKASALHIHNHGGINIMTQEMSSLDI